MDENTVFRLTFEDFETVLDRELTEDEKDLISRRFTIENWSDYVGFFLDVNGIE
jgi:hypothetical protein